MATLAIEGDSLRLEDVVAVARRDHRREHGGVCRAQGPGSGGECATRDRDRATIPPLEQGRPQSPDIEASGEMLRDGSLIMRLEDAVGPLEPGHARQEAERE
ncbi:MAG: hypothetical protein A2133_02740 [Actinobacteria bacterium RBG_16_64_13]|nr:MAG: hypothetical protein A2133_02740 [Actinobacteria bacterium RBG_16_64_13]